MNSVTTQLGRKFDLTIFDACLMSLVEVADQLTNVTNYVIASEQSIPFQGFPYDAMLQRIVSNPSVPIADYAKGIVDDYYNYYAKTNSKASLTISAINENGIKTLASSIDALSLTLIANMQKFTSAIGSARSNAQHQVQGSNAGIFWYVDIHNFADQLIKRISDTTVSSQAAAVINNIGSTLYERHSNNLDGTLYGLGVNFPPNLSKYQDKNYLAQNYQDVNLVFTNETHWDEMILASY